jgi:hypothetical protein
MYTNLNYSSLVLTEFHCISNFQVFYSGPWLVMTTQLFQPKSFIRGISRTILLLSCIYLDPFFFEFLVIYKRHAKESCSVLLGGFFSNITSFVLILTDYHSIFNFMVLYTRLAKLLTTQLFTRYVLESYFFFVCTNRVSSSFSFQVFSTGPACQVFQAESFL